MKNRPNGEPTQAAEHQKASASKVIFSVADNASTQMTQKEIENRVREVVGRTDAEVLSVSPKRDGSGKIVAYEVDIR